MRSDNSPSPNPNPNLLREKSKSGLSMYSSPSASIIDLKNLDYSTTMKRYRQSLNVQSTVLRNKATSGVGDYKN